MTNPTTTNNENNEHRTPKPHRYMVALVVQAEHLAMPTRITFQGKGVGQSGASIMCLWFRSNAEGQAWSEHLGGRAGLHVNAETGRTWLDHGPIDWHGWSMILHADDEPAEDGQPDTDPGSNGQPTPKGPCWNGFCINSFCDGVNHVDPTGYTWVEVRPQRGER